MSELRRRLNMSNLRWYGLNRTYCNVCEEMRQILDQGTSLNYDASKQVLRSLVEELQVYGNRMESALGDQRDVLELHKDIKKLKKEVRELEEKKDKLDEPKTEE